MVLKRENGKILYIFEACLEYLIAILCTGSYLATLTGTLGMSDGLTGVISSFVSLGCLFQLISMFVQIKRQKSFVVVLSIINQVLFSLLYVIPLFGIKKETKIVFFVIAIFAAYIIYNIVHPKKINWLMSLVDDSKRGKFTANKQIFSLVSGMVFSFFMGAVIDYYSEIGERTTAFFLCAVVIFVLMILHTFTLVFTVEEKNNSFIKKNIKTTLNILKDKDTLNVVLFFVLYYIANGMTAPFYGTYTINELGMNLKLVSVLTILGSAARILVERPFGKYADKKSFAKMTERSLLFLVLSYGCMTIAVPSNGKIMVALYLILHAMSMAGISSALINLIFEFVWIRIIRR